MKSLRQHLSKQLHRAHFDNASRAFEMYYRHVYLLSSDYN